MSHDHVDRSAGATPPPCPRCGGKTTRVHRRATDHWFAAARREPLLRFECRSAACGWSGLRAPDAAPGGDRRRPLVAGALLALLVGAAAVGLVAITADRWLPGSDAEPASAQGTAALRPQFQDAATQVPPAGWHAVGEILPSDDARHVGHAAGLQLRHGCTWGVPGRDPYRGTAEQALQAAGLPADAVRAIAQRIRSGESDGVVTLAREGIQSADGQRQFGRRLVASTYGMTLCFDTLVNFAEGHVERAPLFEFTSADGRRFSVIVPEVCGNVGVISDQPSAGIVLGERAERAANPVAQGAMGPPTTTPVAPPQAGPYGARVTAAPPPPRAGGRPDFAPVPPTGGPSPRGPAPQSTPPPTPADPTPHARPEPPIAPPMARPDAGAPPPGSGGTPSPQDITPPQPPVGPPAQDITPPQSPQPPVAPTPPAVPKPPVTTPAGDPGTETPPPGSGGTPPPQDLTPPQPPQPQVGPTPPASPEPPRTPPTVDPDPGATPPVGTVPPPAPPTPPLPLPVKPTQPAPPQPPPTPPPTPEAPELPPPSDPPPWMPPEPPWLPPDAPPWDDDPPPPPFPAEPELPRAVPAPGTLSTGLLGLAALMLSRRWCRRRQR